MKLITLKNDFHRTAVRVSAAWGETPHEAWESIQAQAFDGWSGDRARRTLRRVEKALCGALGCACGIVRGPQE